MCGTAKHITERTHLENSCLISVRKCKLSKIYTNHSIRVTGVTVLRRMQFASSEIMAITGHKSEHSLTRYAHTQDRKKIEMGNVMHQSMIYPEEEIQVCQKQIKGT